MRTLSANLTRLLIVAVVTLGCDGATAAVDEGAPAAARLTPRIFTKQHEGRFNGVSMRYATVAEEIILRDREGRPAASMFGFAYIGNSGGGPGRRPVTFIFHGGPGASSFGMNVGVFGPRRLDYPDGTPGSTAAPYHLVDNELSILDVTDLVFIDPPETGFSRILKDGKPADFLGVKQDAKAVADFIEKWLTRNGRWNSPKILLGESYGALRASLVARELMGGLAAGAFNGIALNGVIVLGQTNNRSDQQLTPTPGNDRPYQMLLPTMAAIAWYHDKIDRAGRTVEQVIAEAQSLAAGEYGTALYAGDRLDADSRKRIAASLARLIGLRAEYILQKNLRVNASDFAGKLLEGENKVIGLYDGRYVAPTPTIDPDLFDDASLSQILPQSTAAWHDTMRSLFGVSLEDKYVFISFTVNTAWDYSAFPPEGYVNAATLVGATMKQNPGLYFFIGSGYYDLVTNLGAAEYAATHSGIAPERLWLKTYPSGHMPYVGDRALRAMSTDVRAFIRKATEAR